MRLKDSFIMIIFILAAGSLAAQGDFVIYEGTQLNYRVGFNDGNTYAWNVVNGSNTIEYDFVTDPDLNEVGLKWNIAGNYMLRITESHSTGCSTTRELSVIVQPNNRSIGFDVVASTECFNLTENNFQLAVSVLENSGNALSSVYFPLTVEFTVNGVIQSQLLEYDNQILQINETMFSAIPNQNTGVEVAIANVTDVKNAPIQAGATTGTHVRTIFAIPEIEFTEELRKRYNLKYETTTAYIDTDMHRLERMEPK